MDEIIKKLNDIGHELNRKFGTDSYTIRCELHDIRKELGKKSGEHKEVTPRQIKCDTCGGFMTKALDGDYLLCLDCGASRCMNIKLEDDD